MANPTRANRSPFPADRLTRVLLIVFLLVAAITAVVAFIVVRDFISGWSLTTLPGEPIDQNNKDAQAGDSSPDNPDQPQSAAPENPLQPASGPSAKPWDGKSRVNILVLGLDARDWEAGETPKSDTMILFTIDPVSMTAGMLSIPRDLWVNIPGFGYYKINMAYFFGESQQLPGGGPELAMNTVEEFLGVPIQYYAQIDFNAFVKFIDHIEGVKITVENEITLETIGSYKETTLTPGRYTLDGPLALAYARERYSTKGGDVDRAKRTQQVILAVRDRILDFNMLPTLIANSPTIYKDLSEGIHTNLNLDQVIQLALLAQDIGRDNIRHEVIDYTMAVPAISIDGLDILIAIPDQIRIARDNVFTTGGPVSPQAVAGDELELVKTEAARISVQNGTLTPGLASRSSKYFNSLGLNIVEEANAELASYSTIIDYTGKPYTLNYLVKLMAIQPTRVFSRYDPNAAVDVVVILGDDWAANNQMP